LKNIVGVDFGATQMRAARLEEYEIVILSKEKTAADAEYKAIMDQLINLIQSVFNEETMAIGIGVPSVVDPEQGIIYDVINIPSWKKVPLKSILEAFFSVPVWINNDANCFVLGEKYFGMGKMYRHIAGVTLGSGVGTGLILNSKLYAGKNLGAGEFGMVPYLDKYFEFYCSGQFFNRYKNVDGLEVFRKAVSGDLHSISLYQEFGFHLGHFLKVLVLAIDPEVIILGGSLSKAYSFFEKEMNRSLEDFPYPNTLQNLEIMVSATEHIAVLGAAALILNEQEL
jgi:glucokinase